MHITILAIGTLGDVQPYVALGRGLLQAGHQVRLATHSNFQALVTGYGLEFASIAGDPQEILKGEAGQVLLGLGYNAVSYGRLLARAIGPIVEQCLVDSWQACQDTEVIIFNILATVGYHIAEKLEVPSFGAWTYPASRTQSFPAVGSPYELQGLGRIYNSLTHLIAEQVSWYPFRKMFNKWRQETLQLPPIPISGLFARFYKQQVPILYAYSPSVVPPPSDWPDWLVVTGYWFLDSPIEWRPPADLVDFLAAGPSPIYIGFGSMINRSPAKMVELIVEALSHTRQRGILLTGWGEFSADMKHYLLRNDIFVTDSVPHDWLFPQVTAVVHHGGAGTTAAGLRAGIPNIIIPLLLDQPFWGQQIAKLGVGPSLIPFKELSAQRLAAAIQTVVNDKDLQTRAKMLGQQIRAEDGVARAIEAFERFIARAKYSYAKHHYISIRQ